MSEDKKTLLEIKLWLEDVNKIGSRFVLPHVDDDDMVIFYRRFFEVLCQEIAKVRGAEKLFGLMVGVEEETEDADRLE